ncbi:MAG: DUF484 family protein [Alphaproteobacteria bacterium]
MAAKADESVERGAAAPTAEQVAGYLRRNPGFLLQYPDLATVLQAPDRFAGTEQPGGSVIDLQRYMVERLRSDIDQVEVRNAHLVDTSRENLVGQRRIHEGVLAMLGAGSFEQLIEVVTTDLAIHLDIDVVSICIESAKKLPEAPLRHSLIIMDEGLVDEVMGIGVDCILRDAGVPAPDRELVFGGGAGLIDSDALLRIQPHPSTPQGILALGSREPDKFSPDQGTELLLFLARCFELSLRTWVFGRGVEA